MESGQSVKRERDSCARHVCERRNRGVYTIIFVVRFVSVNTLAFYRDLTLSDLDVRLFGSNSFPAFAFGATCESVEIARSVLCITTSDSAIWRFEQLWSKAALQSSVPLQCCKTKYHPIFIPLSLVVESILIHFHKDTCVDWTSHRTTNCGPCTKVLICQFFEAGEASTLTCW